MPRACWVIGAARGKHATVWTVHARPECAVFVRIERHHLVVCEQRMDAVGLPADYALDATRFRSFLVVGPTMPAGGGVDMHPDNEAISTGGAWFRRLHVQPAGMKFTDGTTLWQARGFYNALEIPWWSLLLLFSLLPVAVRRPPPAPGAGEARAVPGLRLLPPRHARPLSRVRGRRRAGIARALRRWLGGPPVFHCPTRPRAATLRATN